MRSISIRSAILSPLFGSLAGAATAQVVIEMNGYDNTTTREGPPCSETRGA